MGDEPRIVLLDEEEDQPADPPPLGEEEEDQPAPPLGEEEDQPADPPPRAFPADPARALEAKARGNALYQKGEYEEAAEAYSDALDYAADEDAEGRAVFLSNRAACFFMLRQFDEAVKDCTPALELKPGYLKCLRRRARAYEELDRLAEALEDWKALSEAAASDREARAKVVDVGRRLEAQREKQKEEMLAKLKDLGNGILGKFGMSLDNFNAVKDPNTGSYSISFGQGGGGGGGGGGSGGGGSPA